MHDAEPGSDERPRGRGSAESGEANSDPIGIDIDGLLVRAKRVPVEPGNYSSLQMGEGALFYRARGSGAGASSDLMGLAFANDDPEPVAVVEGIGSFEV